MMQPMKRLSVLTEQLSVTPCAGIQEPVPGKTSLNSPDILKSFVSDADWAGKPFWMLNVLKFSDAKGAPGSYATYAQGMKEDVLPKIGARIVMSGCCRTVIGKNDYHQVAIVEYPSPEAFLQILASGAQSSKNQARLGGLEEQYLIPMRPGWYHIDRAAPEVTRDLTTFTVDNVWTTPSGLIGSSATGSRIGETSSTKRQAEAFVTDSRLRGNKALWHLNLLHFLPGNGEANYKKYAAAMGSRAGVLSQFGARSTMASTCYRSLIGEVDFDQAIFVEYPCRDAYLSMATSKEYLATAHFRHLGLQDTYILSCLPEFIDTDPVQA